MMYPNLEDADSELIATRADLERIASKLGFEQSDPMSLADFEANVEAFKEADDALTDDYIEIAQALSKFFDVLDSPRTREACDLLTAAIELQHRVEEILSL